MKRILSDHSTFDMIDAFQSRIKELESRSVTSSTWLDPDGMFGEPGGTYTESDMIEYWDAEHETDWSLSQFESFEDWWDETKKWLRKINASDEASQLFRVYETSRDGIRKPLSGKSDFHSRRDAEDAMRSAVEFEESLNGSCDVSFDIQKVDATPVVTADYVDIDDEQEWEELAHKQVPDSDGFMTEYTLYRNLNDGSYGCVFGDRDWYRPESGDLDWEGDSEDEAWEWYNSYEGFQEDDEILSDTELENEHEDNFEPLSVDGFMDMFEIMVDLDIREQAADILYRWYTEEGEDTMPTRSDVLDMCDAADDETEKRIVLEAMGEEIYDWDDENVDDDIYSAEDVSTDNDAVIEWFDDSSASVMDADWTADGEIIVSLDHNVQDIETTAAELISCIEPNGYHVSDWNVNGHNVFIFEVISNDEYAELAADHQYILEDDDIYSATALYRNPYDEEGKDVKCATIADNGEQVFQLMEYYSNPEAGIEGDDFYCYGEFFAKDEDDALKQLDELKESNPEFAKLADQVNIYVQPYSDRFDSDEEVYQNISALVSDAFRMNDDGADDELPFASTSIKASYQQGSLIDELPYDAWVAPYVMTDSEQAKVDNIAYKFTGNSKPVGSSWEDEIADEMLEIGQELAIDEKHVNYIMIEYLGFDPEDVKQAWSDVSTTYYDAMNEGK